MKAHSVDSDSVASHLDIHWLLSHICKIKYFEYKTHSLKKSGRAKFTSVFIPYNPT